MSIEKLYISADGDVSTEQAPGCKLYALQVVEGNGRDRVAIEISHNLTDRPILITSGREVALTLEGLRNLQAALGVLLGGLVATELA